MNQSEELPSVLNFDIYERVHTKQDIDRIVKSVLPTRIKVYLEADRAIIAGHLLLSIIYTDSNELEKILEHEIPVEITIPKSRVLDAWRISGIVQSFDVQQLSKRTLVLTGLFTINLGADTQ